jgi:hypothetical protein
MNPGRSSRIVSVALALALFALPIAAWERTAGDPHRGFFEVLSQAMDKLVPALAGLVDGLLPEAGAPDEGPEEPRPEGDLGPGLDPLG